MELIQVSHNEMAALFTRPSHIYNSVGFALLNAPKADSVEFLTFRDTRLRGGLILGMCGAMARSPFSAPFGGLLLTREQTAGAVEDMYLLAAQFAASRGMVLRVTLPPPFISPGLYAKSVNVLQRLSGGCATVEINYHVDLRGVTDPVELYSRSAREKLRQARSHDCRFERLETTPEAIARVYDVIHRNRLHRGFPHNMALEQIVATSAVVPMDLFMLTVDGTPAAAAQVHRLNHEMAQVVYWGDLPEAQYARPMNLLPLEIYKYYLAHTPVRILDIGHSTDGGIINRGLCDYKESVGCRATPKPTFTVNLRREI